MVDGPNLYAYVNANPWTRFDPEGLSAWDFVAGGLQGWGEASLPSAWVPARPAHPSADYRSGLLTGHIGAMGLGTIETDTGGGMAASGSVQMATGVVVAVGGVVTGPGAAVAEPAGGEMIVEGEVKVGVGTAVAAHGVWAGMNGARLLADDVNSMMSAEGTSGADPEGNSAQKNYEAGKQRENQVQQELQSENPNASVQRERMLRDSEGNKVVDPLTGEGRRVDHAVINRESNTAKTYETTGNNVDKRLQLEKEARIREQGGTYVRDKETRKLVPTEGQSELRRKD